MPRSCTACLHPQRAEIDKQIEMGQSIPAIARAFDLKESPLYRHRDNCKSKTSASAKPARAGVVSQLEFLKARDIELAHLQEVATTRGHSAAACQIVRERRQVSTDIEKLRTSAEAESATKGTHALTIALLDSIVNGEFHEL